MSRCIWLVVSQGQLLLQAHIWVRISGHHSASFAELVLCFLDSTRQTQGGLRSNSSPWRVGLISLHNIIRIIFNVPNVTFVLGQLNQQAMMWAPQRGSCLRGLRNILYEALGKIIQSFVHVITAIHPALGTISNQLNLLKLSARVVIHIVQPAQENVRTYSCISF